MVMQKYNVNYEMVFYPTEEGWDKIKEILEKKYKEYSKDYTNIDFQTPDETIKKHKTEDNGYKDQMWVIIANFNELFFNGSSFLKHTTIELF